ncbi:hypothetical protein FRC01_006234 [Tulasnella sp. 417]|nr:hypothetical protein FRC01_006234 [Tulasnella sp. 417]
MTGELPCGKLPARQIPLKVWNSNNRNGPVEDWSKHPQLRGSIEELLMDCWSWEPSERPTMSAIIERLTAVLESLELEGHAHPGAPLIAGPSQNGSMFATPPAIPNYLQWNLPFDSPSTPLGPTLQTTSNGPTHPGLGPPAPWMEAEAPVVKTRAVEHKPVLVDVGPNESIRSWHGEIVTSPSPRQFAARQPPEGLRPLRQVRGPRAQPETRSSRSRGQGNTLGTTNNNERLSVAGNQGEYLPPIPQQPLPLLNPNAMPTGGAQVSQEPGTAEDSEDEDSASGEQGVRPPHPNPSLWFGQKVFTGIGPLNHPGANQL